MSTDADISKLYKLLKKYLMPICDEGSWKERSGTHRRIVCKYKGCSLNFTFAHRPKGKTKMVNVYKQVRTKLEHCGLRAPDKLKVKMVGPFDVDRYLDGLFDSLDIQEKLFIKKDKQSGAGRYIREARKKQTARVRAVKGNKPYKTKVSYDVVGGVVTYDRYYSWMKKKLSNGKKAVGYFQVDKGTYQEAVIMWRQEDK